ncbi:MAG: FKBP-type peptidyl-prolyl cis-trans isomerase [Spirochaetales bacterium]|nr:FKBP-type peptidyl-prolyl cis-trans isomerase [Spirochaetales bacterium]
MKRILPFLALLLVCSPGLFASGEKEELAPGLYAVMETSRGTMTFQLDYEGTPLAVANFCGLAEGILPNEVKELGEPYYDGMMFYNAIPNYAVFSGDPSADGSGGPGYTLPRETGSMNAGLSGALVADGFGSESQGSRFFLTLGEDAYLDQKYTAFGHIVHGEQILRKLRNGDVIHQLQIQRIGADAEAFIINERVITNLKSQARTAEIEALGSKNPELKTAILALGEGLEKSPTGIYYSVENSGEGSSPKNNDRVSMHYTGRFLNGQIFDSSVNRGQTFDFTLGRDGVIPGWIEMVTAMKAGEKRQVIIPPHLGYGDREFGPIAPNSWLVFEMELVGFTSGE